jgi:hypothetical protein
MSPEFRLVDFLNEVYLSRLTDVGLIVEKQPFSCLTDSLVRSIVVVKFPKRLVVLF